MRVCPKLVWGLFAVTVALVTAAGGALAADSVAVGDPEPCLQAAPTMYEQLNSNAVLMEQLLLQARAALDEGKPDLAAEALWKARGMGWHDKRLASMMGEYYLSKCRFVEAIRELRVATYSDTDRQNLADALASEASRRIRKQDLKSALSMCREAVEIDNSSGFAKSMLAVSYLYMGDLEAADRHARLAVEIEPELAVAWTHLGLVKLAMGDVLMAQQATCRATKLDPENPVATSNLAYIRFEQGEFKEAKALWLMAIDLNISLADPKAGLALAYLRLGETTLALRTYNKAVVRDKSYLDRELLKAWHQFPPKALEAAGEIIDLRNAD